ncbi:ORF18 [Chlamys acute necrobiotic virus]|nr:ORF18 [Chlamys acute necrobiotic virus]
MEQGKGAINTMDDILNVFNEFIAEFESYNDMVKVKVGSTTNATKTSQENTSSNTTKAI